MLSVILNGHWRPGVGDPDLAGWVITFLYIATTVVCFACFLNFPDKTVDTAGVRRHSKKFWVLAMVIMFFGGVNKQLDLQSWLTLTVRGVFRDKGWYANRHVFQNWCVAGFVLAGACVLFVLLWYFRRRARYWPGLLGLCGLTVFICSRAVSWHRVDEVLYSQFMAIRLKNILESVSIFGVFFSGVLCLRQKSYCNNFSCKSLFQRNLH